MNICKSHLSCYSNFAITQNIRDKDSCRLPPRFQRKAQKARHCVVSQSLWKNLLTRCVWSYESDVNATVGIKGRSIRNTEYLPEETIGSMQSQTQRLDVYNTNSTIIGQNYHISWEPKFQKCVPSVLDYQLQNLVISMLGFNLPLV